MIVGSADATVTGGQAKTLKLELNSTGNQLLAKRHRLQTKVIVRDSGKVVARKVVTFHQG